MKTDSPTKFRSLLSGTSQCLPESYLKDNINASSTTMEESLSLNYKNRVQKMSEIFITW